jgi:hypothetical protein
MSQDDLRSSYEQGNSSRAERQLASEERHFHQENESAIDGVSQSVSLKQSSEKDFPEVLTEMRYSRV